MVWKRYGWIAERDCGDIRGYPDCSEVILPLCKHHRERLEIPPCQLEALLISLIEFHTSLIPMVASHFEFPQDSVKSENVLDFDWRELTALGVSWEEARSIATRLVTKQFMRSYWQRLMRANIPADDARRIARAIAKFDVMELPPTPQQQVLIQRYCPTICRVGLWRAELLLHSRT